MPVYGKVLHFSVRFICIAIPLYEDGVVWLSPYYMLSYSNAGFAISIQTTNGCLVGRNCQRFLLTTSVALSDLVYNDIHPKLLSPIPPTATDKSGSIFGVNIKGSTSSDVSADV